MLIKIPRNTLVLLVGPAGSGKSTFSAKHFLPTQIVSSDECRALVCDDAANQAASRDAFEVMHFIIDKRLRLGRLTVADATNLTKDSRAVLKRLAQRHQFHSAAIVFDVSLKTCLARNAARKRIVPDSAVVTQHKLLTIVPRVIAKEHFKYKFILSESEAQSSTVKIGRKMV